MSTISLADIDERIRIFPESVRKGMYGFKAGESWWQVKPTMPHNSFISIINSSMHDGAFNLEIYDPREDCPWMIFVVNNQILSQ
jgi:hypothetical protein